MMTNGQKPSARDQVLLTFGARLSLEMNVPQDYAADFVADFANALDQASNLIEHKPAVADEVMDEVAKAESKLTRHLLTWSPSVRPKGEKAKTSVGTYLVAPNGCAYCDNRLIEETRDSLTVEFGKAAAQADYERRIRSALASQGEAQR